MCVVSSAWMQAVPGLMDHVDTLPGLSTELSEKSDSHEGQVEHCPCLYWSEYMHLDAHKHAPYMGCIDMSCICIAKRLYEQ